ncbi:DUF3829 domain-containing protein [Prosthecomicrobium sp. N25]|uniref:DUF3829 domain-containing protein n=1 Tax=Prosthecomicrobium sp. N25 TaxID=3129254 RepID=UPI003076DDEF
MRPFLALATLLALLLAPAAAGAQSANPFAATVVVPDLKDDELALWIAKSNVAVKLLNDTLRAKESYGRYASWVDLKKGPTGRERIIYGLYSVSPTSVKDAGARTRKAAGEAPAVPALDQAMLELAAAFESAAPVINEAEGYYERKDYKADGMAGGKALHERLIPAFKALLDARERLDGEHRALKASLDGQELARLERTEGKSMRWHTRRVMILAEKAVDAVPRDPRKADIPAYDRAVEAYAVAVREFDAAVLAGGKSSAFDTMPKSLLGNLRELKDKIRGRDAQGPFYSIHVNQVINQYNTMTTFSSSFFRG